MKSPVPDPIPELSIIIPAYNAAEHITRVLTSLEDQTADAETYQIILVDDGSTDDTLSLCKRFAREYPNVLVIHKENGGVSSARNAGIEAARGKWISFIDSDDYVVRNYVETVISTRPDESCIIFDHFLERGESLVREKKWLTSCFNAAADRSQVLLWICDTRLNAPWDKRFSLDVIQKNGIRFKEGINMGEDLLFNFEYAIHTPAAFISSQAVYIHTDNPDGLCHQPVSAVRVLEYETIYRKMTDVCAANDLGRKCLKTINLAFLRNITRCAAQLYASGLSAGQISALFAESKMVAEVLSEKAVSFKDHIRKILLKTHQYHICALLCR